MDLKECRAQLDQIDAQIAALFEERMLIAAAIADYKIEHGLEVLDSSRETQKLDAVQALVPEEEQEGIREVFRLLMTLSRRKQQEIMDRRDAGSMENKD